MNEGILLAVGLGNNAAGHAAQRHNVGFWYVDLVAQKFNVSFESAPKQKGFTCGIPCGDGQLRLFKAGGFMNHSGRDLSAFMKFYKIPPQRVLVVYDDLDFPVGIARLRFGGGAAGHNGVRDVIDNIGDAFWRLRIGIDRPTRKSQVISYVLSAPRNDEKKRILHCLDVATGVLEGCASGQFERATEWLHTSSGDGGA